MKPLEYWLIAKQTSIPKVHVTHEPRRHSKLGKIALSAVSKGTHTPLEEAGLFAADRVDHSHTPGLDQDC